ncbi:HAD family hydrolase [Aestuariivirga sp.]|uniref:HAD family hydrolase n=1 Tax=Aestuariivirga sp. TaxID=2650926 RepID=UPI0035940E2E
MDSAVIFDVDGVLLDLTAPEEDAFFLAFERRYGLKGLSRDWDSYKVRNDEHIIAEILERHGLPADDRAAVAEDYLSILQDGLAKATLRSIAIPGAADLLRTLTNSHCLGIATANLLSAARIRLASLDMWNPVSSLAFGAEGSGHKRETVARAIAASGLPKHRIVYVGDNLNDVDAGLSNGAHFIGFSESAARRETLAAAGAVHLSGNHHTTARLITGLLER